MVLIKASLCLGALLLAFFVTPLRASAEWFADLYVGGNQTVDEDLTTQATDKLKFQNVEYNRSVTFGGRVGWWLPLDPIFGLGLDVSHFEPDIGSQTVNVKGTGPTRLQAIDVSATLISPLLMLRWPLLTTEDMPNGRLQPYGFIGPAIAIADADDTRNFTPNKQSKTDQSVGFKLGGGLAWQFHKHLAVFGEYQFSRFGSEFKFLDVDRARVVNPEFNTHHIVGGISFRF